MEKVTGIGGVFFHAEDPEKLGRWYEKHLGIKLTPSGWDEPPWHQEGGPTSVTFGELNTSRDHLSERFGMMTFRVRDLDAMVAQLQVAGIAVKIHKSDTQPDGRHATLFDPERNAVELWEPRGSRDITVRAATLANIPLLADMMEEFYAEAKMPLDRAQAGAGFAGLLSDASRGAAWIVCDEGEPAGYVVLTVRFSMEYGGLDGFIDDLFVRASHRRRGLARAALKELFVECRRRGVLALHVEVGQSNVAAKALYAGSGLAPRTDDRELLTTQLTMRAPAPDDASRHQGKNADARRGKRFRKPRAT